MFSSLVISVIILKIVAHFSYNKGNALLKEPYMHEFFFFEYARWLFLGGWMGRGREKASGGGRMEGEGERES